LMVPARAPAAEATVEWIGEEVRSRLPAEAQDVLAELATSTAEVLREARAELAEERRDHIDDLERALRRVRRRGDLAGVQAIEARIAEITALVETDEDEPSTSVDLLAPGSGSTPEPEADAPAVDLDSLPDQARRHEARLKAEIEDLVADAAEDLYDARDDAQRDLERVVKSLTRDDALEAATQVQEAVAALRAHVLPPDFLGPTVWLPMGGQVVRGDVARSELGATVAGGHPPGVMIDGVTTGYTGGSGFTAANWPCAFTVDLQQVYTLREIRILLWDGSQRFYRYALEVSPDGEHWATVADRSEGEWRSWQTIELPRPVPIRYIRLNGLFNSANSGFHVVELEAWCIPPEPVTPRFPSTPPAGQ